MLVHNAFGYSWRYITDKSNFNDVFNDEPGCMNGVTPCFQENLDSPYSIMMAASVFDSNAENACFQLAFGSFILVHHLEWCYGVPLNTRLLHLLFALTLNSGRCISVALRLAALPIIRTLRNATFHQDNARPQVSGIVRTFLYTENVRLLPWSALFHYQEKPSGQWLPSDWLVNMSQSLLLMKWWHLVDAAWAILPVHAIKPLYRSILRHITAVIASRDGCSRY